MRKTIILGVTFLFLLAACAPQSAQPTGSVQGPPTPETEQPSGVMLNDPSLFWREMRDEKLGFGFAVPCWWEAESVPSGNFLSVINIRNYNDRFFTAYSENGEWKGGRPPQGVVVLNLTAAATASGLSMEEAYLQYTNPGTVEVIANQEKQIGSNTYTLLTLKNVIDPSLSAVNVYVISIASEAILIVNIYPPEAMFEADVAAILASLVDADTAMSLPLVQPAPGLIDMACPI